jgi:hypothetical protein
MRTVSISKTLAASSVNGIAQSQSVAAAGTLTLNGSLVTGGVANLGSQRRVLITSAGNDSARKATVVGTNATGTARTDIVNMASAGAVVTPDDFLTVSTISVDGSIASTVTVGTNGTGSTDWIMPNFHMTPFDVTIDTEVTGSVTYSIETTLDNYWDAKPVQPTVNIHTFLNSGTVSAESVLSTAVTGYRYTITSGTGTLTAQSTQAGITNRN